MLRFIAISRSTARSACRGREIWAQLTWRQLGTSPAGPLSGIRVLEMSAIGPVPYACMLLSDLGAEIIRIDRIEGVREGKKSQVDPILRGRRGNIAIDLKRKEGVELMLDFVKESHVLVEGYRPGVMEKFGLSPVTCMNINPQLCYGRMTGYGQFGTDALKAGHDINYLSINGLLSNLKRNDSDLPLPPLNLVGDFAGGAMFLLVGILSALISKKGQVIDAAMMDGSASLLSMLLAHNSLKGSFLYHDFFRPGSNLLDQGAPFYNVYECKDGKHISIGAIEIQFYEEFVKIMQLDEDDRFATKNQFNRDFWNKNIKILQGIFITRDRDEWVTLFKETDCCFTPVLSLDEAIEYPHNKQRNLYTKINGTLLPNVAPRFQSVPSDRVNGSAIKSHVPLHPGASSHEVLRYFNISNSRIDSLMREGIVKQNEK